MIEERDASFKFKIEADLSERKRKVTIKKKKVPKEETPLKAKAVVPKVVENPFLIKEKTGVFTMKKAG